jgi:hypothetical protein
MLTKKLAVPLINDKILSQTEHCYIATSCLSEPGFDFIRTRLPVKSKIEVVTGLDELTTPAVLRKIWRNYHERISLKIYTKNTFHANLYIFDLPFRKSIAFIGSGSLTLGGLKDNEELFFKITDPKEIENLKSWFTGYYEFSEEVTENIVQEYEQIYPFMHQREIASRKEKEQLIELTTKGFNWDAIRFKNQYFKKEDFLALNTSRQLLNTPEVRAERASVRNKLLHLHELIKKPLNSLKLYEPTDVNTIVNGGDPENAFVKVSEICLNYCRKEADLKKVVPNARLQDFMMLQISVMQRDVALRLLIGDAGSNSEDREYFKSQMQEEKYRSDFFKMCQSLGPAYSIEIYGERKPLEFFQTGEALGEFIKSDDWRYYSFLIERKYSPSAPEISEEKIADTVMKETDKLILLYRHITAKAR